MRILLLQCLLYLCVCGLLLAACAPQTPLTPHQERVQQAHRLCMNVASMLNDAPSVDNAPLPYLDYEQCMRQQLGI